MSTNSDSEDNNDFSPSNAKRRKKTGRISDATKKIRNQSHALGPDCKCHRYKCFEVISPEEREDLIKQFNLLESFNVQNAHLCGLITIGPVARRRPRADVDIANPNDCSYAYKVRIKRNDIIEEVSVCHKAFISLHGITNRRTVSLKKALVTTGVSPTDMRGKHNSHHHKLKEETLTKICDHIGSFKSRKAHYSTKDNNSRTYLDEDLNIKKMYNLFLEAFPGNKASYETYRNIFNSKFNISFGYPRSDTCSKCDEFKANMQNMELSINKAENNLDILHSLNKEKTALETENMLHKRRAEKFYEIKRLARKNCRKSPKDSCIAMDFQKNLPLPNLSTNDVYYKRQLSFYSFNVHELSTGRSVFYTYDETVAKKGSEDVASMLYHYISKIMSCDVRNLQIFCDSCCGQNKNYYVFKFLYIVVHKLNLLDTVSVVFPIRGHSYLECDKNMAFINQKAPCEIPEDWRDEFRKARSKPQPFLVQDCQQNMFQSWKHTMDKYFLKKCPFATRPLREIKIDIAEEGAILHREFYTSPFEKKFVLKNDRSGRLLKFSNIDPPPVMCYSTKLKVKKEKLKDLMFLKRFCGPKAQEFFESLQPHEEDEPESDRSDVENIDN